MTTRTFTAPLWRWDRKEEWFFVTVPQGESDELRELPLPPRGFGSIKVRATIGASTWSTSLFPDAEIGCYVLPVKRSIRDAEGIGLGENVEVTIEVV